MQLESKEPINFCEKFQKFRSKNTKTMNKSEIWYFFVTLVMKNSRALSWSQSCAIPAMDKNY